MKKLSFVVLAALACAACSHHAPSKAPESKASTAETLTRQTVALVRFDEEGSAHAYCSGVWIGDSKILTAAHCVRSNPFAGLFGAEEEPPIRFVVRGDVFEADGRESKYPTTHIAHRVRVDEEADLALLVASSTPEHASVKVSTRPIAAGDFAQTMGHPSGLWWSYSSGEVSAVREIVGAGERPAWWVQTTAPISPGNSGCGLFDGAGELIGIASWKNIGRGAEGLGFFVHRDTITAFLRAAS